MSTKETPQWAIDAANEIYCTTGIMDFGNNATTEENLAAIIARHAPKPIYSPLHDRYCAAQETITTQAAEIAALHIDSSIVRAENDRLKERLDKAYEQIGAFLDEVEQFGDVVQRSSSQEDETRTVETEFEMLDAMYYEWQNETEPPIHPPVERGIITRLHTTVSVVDAENAKLRAILTELATDVGEALVADDPTGVIWGRVRGSHHKAVGLLIKWPLSAREV